MTRYYLDSYQSRSGTKIYTIVDSQTNRDITKGMNRKEIERELRTLRAREKNPGLTNGTKVIPASGIIIDKANGKIHIINPGKIRNVAQGYYDATGFHPIRASADYDPDRLSDDSEGSYRRRKKATKKSSRKKATTKKAKKKVSKSRK